MRPHKLAPRWHCQLRTAPVSSFFEVNPFASPMPYATLRGCSRAPRTTPLKPLRQDIIILRPTAFCQLHTFVIRAAHAEEVSGDELHPRHARHYLG